MNKRVTEPEHEYWHQNVYHPRDEEFDIPREEWRQLREASLERDHHKCFRCEKTSKSGKGLGTHHILPRSMGGSNDLWNLITLCHKCHDFVESSGFTTIVEIIASTDLPVEINPTKDNHTTEDAGDWHTWVYGGAKNPRL